MKIFKRILSVIVALSIVATIMSALPVANAYSGTTVTFDDEQVIPTDLGDNLLAGEVPIYLEYKAGNQSYVSKKLYPGNANLTNGVTKDSWHLTEQLFALDNEDGTRTFYDDGSAYCDVVFSLDKTTDINKICVINHPTRNLVTGKYEVYASRYRHELFYSENLIATVDNTANYNYRQLITCSGVTGVNFFAFKFIVPCKNSTEVATVNCYPRLSELCIYGTEAATKETFPHVGNESDKTDAVAYFDDTHLLDVSDGSRNFLKGKNTVDGGLTVTETTFEYYEKKIFSWVYESGYKQVTSTAGEKTDAQACITDGDGSTEWYSSTFRFITSEDVYNVGYTDYRNRNDGRADYDTDSDYDFYVDLLFDAGKSQDLGLFYIKHHSTEAIRTMHYRIYASNSSSMTEADIIADCYNYSGAQEHYITPKSGTTINAR